MLNIIKTLKRYCTATLNKFYIEEFLMMIKKFYLHNRFLGSNQSISTEQLKLLKIKALFSGFCSKFSFFFAKFLKFQVFSLT